MKYAIGIGGTGMRCLEALIYLNAAGLCRDEPLFVIAIDPDESNGNVKRLAALVELYSELQQTLCASGVEYFRSSLRWGGSEHAAKNDSRSLVWSPLPSHPGANPRLVDLIEYPNLTPASKDVCQLLYTRAEREMHLHQGFRGRTSVGATAMATLSDEFDTMPWHSMLQSIKQDGGEGQVPRIFVFASIFGGTGASGFPVVGDILKKKLDGETEKYGLGGALILPYFRFVPDKTHTNGQIFARSENFLLNTKAALRHYDFKWHEAGGPYRALYLVGDVTHVDRAFATGGPQQENPSSFVEFNSALAAIDFFQRGWDKERSTYYASPHQSAYTPPDSGENLVRWSGLPHADLSSLKAAMAEMTAMSLAYLDFVHPLLKDDRLARMPYAAPWLLDNFKSDSLLNSSEATVLDKLERFYTGWLHWLRDIHNPASASHDNIRLFHLEELSRSSDSKKPRDFMCLVREDAPGSRGHEHPYDQLWRNMCIEKRPDGQGSARLFSIFANAMRRTLRNHDGGQRK